MRAAAWLTLGAIAALLLGGLVQLAPYAGLLLELEGRSVAEAGQYASDTGRNFLGRAGRVELRRRLEGRRSPPPSSLGDVWRWCLESSRKLPLDARVYLNVPATQLYFYGSFFWHPAQVDVTPVPAIIRDQRTLSRHAREMETAWLVRRGYTHLVTRGPDGLRMIELSAADSP